VKYIYIFLRNDRGTEREGKKERMKKRGKEMKKQERDRVGDRGI
jgi:hypothetical protein